MKDRKSFQNSDNAMKQELSFQKGLLHKNTKTKTKTKTKTNIKTKTKTKNENFLVKRSYLISLHPLLSGNIALVGSFSFFDF